MRDHVIASLTSTLQDIDSQRPAMQANARLAEHCLRENGVILYQQDRRPEPSRQDILGVCHHEPGHIVAALEYRCTCDCRIDKTTGNGIVTVRGTMTLLQKAVFSMAGPISEIRFYSAAIHKFSEPCFDLLQARQSLDEWNTRGTWPHTTLRGMVKLAADLVEVRWVKIQRLAMALESAGSLDDDDIRLFANCGYQP